MKRRSLTVLLSLLAVISLASVGFASWVISAGDEATAEGSFEVHEVVDKRFEIVNLTFDSYVYNSETAANEMPNFVFGKPTTPDESITEVWLDNAVIGEEKLSIAVTFEVCYKGTTNNVPNADLTTSVVFSVLENKFDADNDTYYAKIVAANPTVSYDEETKKYSFTLEVAWGNYFNTEGENPYNYYNKQEVTNELAEEAKEKLNNMYLALSNAKYNVVIEVTPVAKNAQE